MTEGNQGYGQQPGQYGQQPGQYGQQQPGQYGQQQPGQYGQQQPGQYGQQQPGQYGQGPSNDGPQYGAGSYGQPAGGPGGHSAVATRKFGVTGFIVAVIGAAAVVVAFLAPVNWGKQDKTSYSRIHDLLSIAPSSEIETLAKLYFTWLGWVLLAAAFVFALIAVLPTGASGAFRGLGALVGLGGAVATFFAIKLGTDEGLTDYVKAGRLGFYLAIAGFLVIAVGALIGSRKT